jgi:Xaa-Pro aminopeptidase
MTSGKGWVMQRQPTEAHRADVRRRLTALRAAMATDGVDAFLGVAQGAPGMGGILRYFTNVELWAGRAFLLATPDDEDPLVIMWSNYGAEWAKQMATTPRVVSTIQEHRLPVARVIDELRRIVRPGQRVGVANLNTVLSLTEYRAMTDALPGVEFADFTAQVNAIRQIKSPFEIEAMEETGAILAGALEAFGEAARPGVLAWEAAAEAERYAKAHGCFWGRSKYSLDQRPFTVPTPLDRRFQESDVILFEMVYQGPLGYWLEITCVYSFGPLPDEVGRRLEAWQEAVRAAAAVARPGTPFGEIGRAADRTLQQLGYTVIGKHTPDCHSIGTDEADGITPPPPDEPLRENMVLSLHPAALVEGGYAFLISDNYQITPQGGRVLSPLGRPYRQLKA